MQKHGVKRRTSKPLTYKGGTEMNGEERRIETWKEAVLIKDKYGKEMVNIIKDMEMMMDYWNVESAMDKFIREIPKVIRMKEELAVAKAEAWMIEKEEESE